MVRDTDLGSPSWRSWSGSLESDKATKGHIMETVVSALRCKRIRGGRGPVPHRQVAELRLTSEGCQTERRISQAEGEVRAPPGRGDSR